MKMDRSMEILSFLKTQSRNKVVFYKEGIKDITEIDLGTELSQVLYNLYDLTKLPMKVLHELEIIMNKATIEHPDLGKTLAISNFGMLFEPELKIDFHRFLEKYSNNNVLFVKWEGEIDNENLYFHSKEKGIKTNIKNLSHIAI
jgi:phage pi2 protein 07